MQGAEQGPRTLRHVGQGNQTRDLLKQNAEPQLPFALICGIGKYIWEIFWEKKVKILRFQLLKCECVKVKNVF